MKTAIALAVSTVAVIASAQTPPAPPMSAPPRAPHIVLVGDSTVTEGSGWGLGFRQLVGPGVIVTNTAQNGRSSKSFRDEGHWATALAAKGDYYLIQFGHNDQPGKGPERETDPATTFPANMARYVDEVRAIGATPILVTSLVRRTFSETEPAKLTSTLGPWVEAVKRVAVEKRVPLIDLDASSRALCERLGPVETARFNLKTDDGTWDTTHLDAAGSLVFARLVVEDLRRAVPALAPLLRDDVAVTLEEPPDLPPPFPLLAGRSSANPRSARCRWAASTRGRFGSTARAAPGAQRPAAGLRRRFRRWSPRRRSSSRGTTCRSSRRPASSAGSPRARRVASSSTCPAMSPGQIARDIQPLTVTFERVRIRELLEPFEADVRRVRWVAVLDPARLRAPSFLLLADRRRVPGRARNRLDDDRRRSSRGRHRALGR